MQKIIDFFTGDPDFVRCHVGDHYLPNLALEITITPFAWGVEFRKSHSAAWCKVGPLDIGITY